MVYAAKAVVGVWAFNHKLAAALYNNVASFYAPLVSKHIKSLVRHKAVSNGALPVHRYNACWHIGKYGSSTCTHAASSLLPLYGNFVCKHTAANWHGLYPNPHVRRKQHIFFIALLVRFAVAAYSLAAKLKSVICSAVV